MKKQIIFTLVVAIMCLALFVFGGGFGGIGQNGGGTLDISDGNRFVVFVSKAQLDEYVASHTGDAFNVPHDERAKYDDAFFETQALVMFLTDGMSGSIKVSYEGYKLEGDVLRVTVKEMSPPIHTMDLRYNTLCAAIPQALATQVRKVAIDSYRVEL